MTAYTITLAKPLLAGDTLTISAPPIPAPIPAPPTGTVVLPGQPLSPVAGTTYLLRTGTHKLAFSAVERHEANVSILPYPGDSPVIDGTGLDPHFLYLGSGASWTLGVPLRNFHPTDSGVVAVGDACSLHTVDGFRIDGAPLSAGVREPNSHLVYFHGSGSGILDNPILLNAPGAAVHSYRGSAKATINGGRLGGLYETALLYNGTFTFTGTAFVEPKAAWDIDVGDPTVVSATLVNCTGTGSGGTVRRHG